MADIRGLDSTQEQTSPVEWGIPEVFAPRVQTCLRQKGPRLNLVLPFLGEEHLYGGAATALRFFDRLSAEFNEVRILLDHQKESDFSAEALPKWLANTGRVTHSEVILLGDRQRTLEVGARDYFLATFWTTAVYARRVIAQQVRWFKNASRRFVYLIQDYEPGFYAWSARHEYAKSTYLDRNGAIAVFNSKPLADYFRISGIGFAEEHVFDPMLHPVLRQAKAELGPIPKERVILVYARPFMGRNGFDVLVEALRVWASTFPRASDWLVVSAGEPHADIPLGNNVVLRPLGKLRLDEYARYLSRSWIGLSFIFSPHPGYTALEMAEFGAWVVTNRFANKTPTELARNMISPDDVTAESIAERISWCCEQYQPGRTAAVLDLTPVFKPEGDEFPFARDLLASWQEHIQSPA